LHSLGKLGDLGSILLISGCHAQGEQASQGIDRQMNLIAFSAPRPVVAGAPSALRSGLHRPAIKNRSGRQEMPTFGNPQHGAQIMDERFNNFCFEPSLRLLINNIPRRQIVRHHSPRRSGADDPSQAVKNLEQGMLVLWSVFGR